MRLNTGHHEFTHFCLFAGMGGLSLGLNKGQARIGNTKATMRCLGGIDVWPTAVSNFTKLTGSRGTVMDLFDRDDYRAFHGKEPPAGWREATPADVFAAAGGEFPDILATSPPCKGFSGLLNNEAAASDKYQALNRLTIRGLALSLSAFADNLPSLILLENVPRIQTRGRALLDTITQLLRAHGYAVAETTHDCGELGGLSQHRQRFLLVARHTQKVRPFLYEPPRRRVRSIGEALEQLPMPEDPRGGAMHRLPRLQWQTWMRLACIKAGKDWRSLQDLAVVDGYLRDICLIRRDWHADALGVREWSDASGTVKGRSHATNGAFSIADPRFTGAKPRFNNVYRLVRWDEGSPAITGGGTPSAGALSVADPRLASGALGQHAGKMHLQLWDEPVRTITGTADVQAGAHSVCDPRIGSYGEHSGKLAVGEWSAPSRTVTCTDRVGSGAQCIADPRVDADGTYQSYGVVGWSEVARTVTSKAAAGSGPYSVADPRLAMDRSKGDAFHNAGFYGVKGWGDVANAVTAKAKADTGHWSVADPRGLPAPSDRSDLAPLIIALDGTWHRPLTTAELAHLQGYPLWDAAGQPLVLDGSSDAAWREQIGNSVPVGAAKAIADEMVRTLALAAEGDGFSLSAASIWVRSYATAVSVAGLGEVA